LLNYELLVGLKIIEKDIRQTYVDAKKVFKLWIYKDSRMSATQFAQYYRNKFIVSNPDPNAEAVDKYRIFSDEKKKPSNAHPSIQMSLQNYLESNRFPLDAEIWMKAEHYLAIKIWFVDYHLCFLHDCFSVNSLSELEKNTTALGHLKEMLMRIKRNFTSGQGKLREAQDDDVREFLGLEPRKKKRRSSKQVNSEK
jgi:hypothetical protein